MSKAWDITQEARRLKEWLISEGQIDPELIADMIEGETDLFGLRDWSIRKYMEEKALSESIAERIKTLTARKAACEGRADKMRLLVTDCMNIIGDKTYRGTDATITVSSQKPRLVVTDESLIPEKFWRVKRELNKIALNEAHKNGEAIAGTALGNGGETLTFRK